MSHQNMIYSFNKQCVIKNSVAVVCFIIIITTTTGSTSQHHHHTIILYHNVNMRNLISTISDEIILLLLLMPHINPQGIYYKIYYIITNINGNFNTPFFFHSRSVSKLITHIPTKNNAR